MKNQTSFGALQIGANFYIQWSVFGVAKGTEFVKTAPGKAQKVAGNDPPFSHINDIYTLNRFQRVLA